MVNSNKKQSGLSEDTKTLIVILLLVFAYPVGLILMWMWMDWAKWLKIILSLPVILMSLVLLIMIAAGIMATVNLTSQTDKAAEQKTVQLNEIKKQSCTTTCQTQFSLITKPADKKVFNLNNCVEACVNK